MAVDDWGKPEIDGIDHRTRFEIERNRGSGNFIRSPRLNVTAKQHSTHTYLLGDTDASHQRPWYGDGQHNEILPGVYGGFGSERVDIGITNTSARVLTCHLCDPDGFLAGLHTPALPPTFCPSRRRSRR